MYIKKFLKCLYESFSFSITIADPLEMDRRSPFQRPNLYPHPEGETNPRFPAMRVYYRPVVIHQSFLEVCCPFDQW